MNSSVYKSKRYIYFMTINANLGALVAGICLVSVNACLYDVLAAVESTGINEAFNQALLSSAMPFGGIFGSLIASFTTGKLGRRKTMILADYLTIAGSILSIMSRFRLILAGRILCGICAGINYMAVPLYVREMSPPEMSGKTGAIYRLAFASGVFLTFLMSFGLAKTPSADDIWWRVIFLTPCVFAILRIVGFMCWVRLDTPRYYIFEFNHRDAIDSLKMIYQDEYVPKIYESEKKVERAQNISDILGYKYRNQVKVLMLLYCISQFTGSSALTFYSTMIFTQSQDDDSGNSDIDAVNQLNLILAVMKIFSALVGGVLADKLGRRPLLVYGNIAITISLFLIGFADYIEYLPGLAIMVIVYATLHGLTYSLVLPIYTSELLPAYGISVLLAFDYLCILVVSFVFPFVDLNQAFLGFAIAGAAFFLPVFRSVKETKGKTLHEIYKMFHAEKSSGLLDDDMSDDMMYLH